MRHFCFYLRDVELIHLKKSEVNVNLYDVSNLSFHL